MNFCEQINSISFCHGSSSVASLFKSSIYYLLGSEMNVLFMGAMSLRFLGLVLFFQLFKPGFVFWGGAVACYFSVCLGEFFC